MSSEDVNRDFFLHQIPTSTSEQNIKEALRVYYIGADRIRIRERREDGTRFAFITVRGLDDRDRLSNLPGSALYLKGEACPVKLANPHDDSKDALHQAAKMSALLRKAESLNINLKEILQTPTSGAKTKGNYLNHTTCSTFHAIKEVEKVYLYTSVQVDPMTNQALDGCAPLTDPSSTALFDDVRQGDVSRDQLVSHYTSPGRVGSVLPQTFRRSEVLHSSTPIGESNVFLRSLHLEKAGRSKRGAGESKMDDTSPSRSKRGAGESKMEDMSPSRSKRGAGESKMETSPPSSYQPSIDMFALPDLFNWENNIPCDPANNQEKSNIASASNIATPSPEPPLPPASPRLTLRPTSPRVVKLAPLHPTLKCDVPYNYRYFLSVGELDMMCYTSLPPDNGDVTGNHGDVTGNHGYMCSSSSPPDSVMSVEVEHFLQNDLNKRDSFNGDSQGDVTGNRGDATGNHGDVTGNHGDVTGNHGDVTGSHGDVTGNHSYVTAQYSIIQDVKEALELLEVFRDQLGQIVESKEFSELPGIALQVDQVIFGLLDKAIIISELVEADSGALLDRVRSVEENIVSVGECLDEESDEEFREDLEESLKVAKLELCEVKCDLLRLKVTNVIEHGLAITGDMS